MWFEKEIVSIRCDTTDCEPRHPLLVGADSKMVPFSHIFLFMMTATYCSWLHLDYKTHMRDLQLDGQTFCSQFVQGRGCGLQL
jgi:hypothetical protein